MYRDGLSGIKESISVAFPHTEYQRCIVHQVRNTLKYVSNKDKKEMSKDLKTIYHAPSESQGHENMLEISEKWSKKYPYAMKSWEANWDVISPLFKFSEEVRKLIYTTNAIESLNSSLRKVTRGKGSFISKEALLKVLYLRRKDLEKSWSKGTKNWDNVKHQLIELYGERVLKYYFNT